MIAFIAGFLAFFLSIVGSMIIYGWALSKMLGWFVAPLFGLPNLRISQTIGLGMTFSLLIQYLTVLIILSHIQNIPDSLVLGALQVAGLSVFFSLTTVGMGWVVKKFMKQQ